MAHTEGGTAGHCQDRSSDGTQRTPSLPRRAVRYAKGVLATLARRLRDRRQDAPGPAPAAVPTREQAPSRSRRRATLRLGPVASLCAETDSSRDRSRAVTRKDGSDLAALPERPGLVAEEADDHLRVADPSNADAYVESDRWIRIRP